MGKLCEGNTMTLAWALINLILVPSVAIVDGGLLGMLASGGNRKGFFVGIGVTAALLYGVEIWAR